MDKYKKKAVGLGSVAVLFGVVALFLGIDIGGITFGDIMINLCGLGTMNNAIYSQLLQIVVAVVGISFGVLKKNDFLAKLGCILSALGIVNAIIQIVL